MIHLEWCCIDAIWSMRKMSLTSISFSLHHFITVARRMELWSEMFLRYLKLFISPFSSIEGRKSNSNELNKNAAKAAHTVTHTPHILPQLYNGYSALHVWFKHLCFPWNEFPLCASKMYGVKDLPIIANNKSPNGWVSWRGMLQPAESQ